MHPPFDPLLTTPLRDAGSRRDPAALRRSVEVAAPGRLHLGFLDPSATLGRRFGSIGLVIDGFETRVVLSAASVASAASADDRADAAANRVSAAGSAAASELGRAGQHLARLQARTGLAEPLHLQLTSTLPAHAGFGSGTQLALAVGRAFALWHGLGVPTTELARWLGRGLRSGVGIAGFDLGGLLLDGGPLDGGVPAPLIGRVPLPAAWRVLLVMAAGPGEGLSGDGEREAIAGLPPLARAAAADVCHQVLMRVMPGAAGDDFAAFAAGVTQVQAVLGAHFAPAQAGSAYAHPAVADAMRWVAGHSGVTAAIGQTSWGPTAFAIVPSQVQAEALAQALQASTAFDAAAVTTCIVAGRNHGAVSADHRFPDPRD